MKMNIDGYHFQYVSDIEPARDADGLLLTMMPQSRYQNRRGLGLNSYGAGPFCKFRISSRYQLSGVYLVTSNDEIRYVGECTNLSSRFNNGYGNISPKNCFKGGQETNCRLNNLVYQAATAGQRARSGFFRPQITSTWKLPFEPASEFRGIKIEASVGRPNPTLRPATVLDIKTSNAICLDVMRTTLTLDDDVSAALARLRKARHAKLKELVNEALRRGLRDMNARPKRAERFRTASVDLGRLRISGIDNVAEVLAIAEGEAFK